MLCDSSFTAGGDVEEKIVKDRKSHGFSDVNNALQAATDLIIQRVLLNERQ